MAHRAFVSSTFLDLKDHRGHVIRSLRNAGFAVDPMEDWTAEHDEPKQFSADRVNGCDLMVLVVAFRRGYVPPGERRSITQIEYDAAVAAGIDVLVFMLDDDAAWPRRFDELAGDPEVVGWRTALRQKHGVGFFGTEATSVPVAPALTRWVAQRGSRQNPSSGPASGSRGSGALRIVQVSVTHQPEPRTLEELERSEAGTAVDFWVTNDGGSQVIVTTIELDVLDTARCGLVKGAFPSSATYDLDITSLKEPGQRASCPVSQMIEPGESDRFTLRLVAPGLGSGVYGVWRMLPRLTTNYGVVEGPPFEAWLPYRDPSATLEQMKDFARGYERTNNDELPVD